MRDKQIMIDGVKYNPCNDCELWDGHHCIGARSYEPNANEHKAICNEHMAKQFYKVYQQLYRKTQECESLKEEIEVLKDNFDTATRDCNELIEELKQENEELLKENQQLRNSLSDSLMFKFTGQENETNRYRKALEEIEKVINNILNSCLGRNTVGCRPAHNVCGDLINILDIINKAKGEGNENT